MLIDFFSSIFQGIFRAILMFWWVLAPVLLAAAWQNTRKTKWVEKQEHMLLTIKVPKSNEKDPTAAEMMFAALHGILRPSTDKIKEGSMQEYLSFEINAQENSINFYVGVPKNLRDFVESQIYAQYPQAEISEVEDYTKSVDIDNDGIDDIYSCAELKLGRNELIPLKTFQNFKVDPLAGITSALSKLDNEKEQVWIQIITKPISDEWQAKGISHIQAVKSGTKSLNMNNLLSSLTQMPMTFLTELFKAFMSAETVKKDAPKLPPNVESELSAIEEKISKLGYQVKIRIISLAKNNTVANQRLQAAIGAFKQFNTINLNSISAKKISNKKDFLTEYRNRAFYDKGFILNIEELASIYHLPHTSVETPNINWTSSKTAEPPTQLPTVDNCDRDELTLFAETNFRHKKTPFGIKIDDRRRHSYIIGKSGMGKSKLLEQMIQEDIDRGHGFAIIDPNGDTIIDTLRKIPDHRVNDVILLDPADFDFPIAFNPLEFYDESMKSFVAQGFITVLARMFGFSWGPRLEYILNYTVLALLDYPDRTILGITRMLTDKDFRKKVVDNVRDPVVKKFWVSEFSTYNDRFASEAVAPILNKVGQFCASPTIRNIMGQPKSAFDLREVMDSNKILLINLATGRVGEVNSSLLGGLIITKMQLAAMSRANIPPEERKDFILYVDEFQHFATEAFATILSEARKYKLSLVVANQYIAQMDEKVRDAVFGNVGTMITFRVGAEDAAHLEKEFFPPFAVEDIVNLDRQQIYLKTSIDGKTTLPFSAKTLTIPQIDQGNTEKIIQLSRERYASQKIEVEGAIARWNNIEVIGNNEIPKKEENNINKNKITPTETPIKKEEAPKNVAEKHINNNISAEHPKTAKNLNNNQNINHQKKDTEPLKNISDKKEPEQSGKSQYTNRGDKKDNRNTVPHNKKIDVDRLKSALQNIKEETKNVNQEKQSEHNNIEAKKDSKEEDKSDEKIDKDLVKKIIKSALGANETGTTNKNAPLHPIHQEPRKEAEGGKIHVSPRTQPIINKEKIIQPLKKTIETLKDNLILKSDTDKEKEKAEERDNIIDPKNNYTHHKIEKEERTEKVITPKNFKEIKEIHPHEKATVKKEDIKELKKGEIIRFDKKNE